jgi:predicted dehydrogenase
MAEGNVHPRGRAILLVGLGAVADTHLTALQDIAGAEIVAGVDSAPGRALTFRRRQLPVYRTLREAAEVRAPSLVVVMTPTPTHADVCDEAVATFPNAEFLVEKPAVDKEADIARILSVLATTTPVNVAYHMAFSPEVLWAMELVRAKGDELGVPTRVQAIFADPYESDLDSARSRFGTSWIDSGINALSVIARFCDIVERTSLRSLGDESWSAFLGRFACRVGEANLDAIVMTTWHVTDASRKTAISFASGAELVMDHHAVAGYLVRPDGDFSEVFGSDGRIPRRETHYRNLYRSYLVDGMPVMAAEESRHLHDLLLRDTVAYR